MASMKAKGHTHEHTPKKWLVEKTTGRLGQHYRWNIQPICQWVGGFNGYDANYFVGDPHENISKKIQKIVGCYIEK